MGNDRAGRGPDHGGRRQRWRMLAVMAERLMHLKRQMPLVLGGSILHRAADCGHACRREYRQPLSPARLGRGGRCRQHSAAGCWISAAAHGPVGLLRRNGCQVIGHGHRRACAAGLLFGLLGHVALSANSGLAAVHTFLFLSGMVAGGIGSLSTIPLAHACFAVPAFLPMIAHFALQPGAGRNSVSMASPPSIFLAVILTYSVNFSRISSPAPSSCVSTRKR